MDRFEPALFQNFPHLIIAMETPDRPAPELEEIDMPPEISLVFIPALNPADPQLTPLDIDKLDSVIGKARILHFS